MVRVNFCGGSPLSRLAAGYLGPYIVRGAVELLSESMVLPKWFRAPELSLTSLRLVSEWCCHRLLAAGEGVHMLPQSLLDEDASRLPTSVAERPAR